MKKLNLAFLLCGLTWNAGAQDFTAVYTFDSVSTISGTVDPTPLVNPANVSLGHFSATGVSANPSAGARFSFTGWPAGAANGATSYSSFTGIADTGKYYSVSLAPDPSMDISLQSVNFTVQRSGTGIRTYIVRSSLDGYGANLPASISSGDTNLSVANGQVFYFNKDNIITPRYGSTVTLGGPAFSNLTAPVVFRFYGYNAEGGAGTFSIDNVVFSGMAGTLLNAAEKKARSEFICTGLSEKGLFEIDCGSDSQDLSLMVYNMLGEIVLTRAIMENRRQELDLSGQPGGMYLLILNRCAEPVFGKKLIKR